MKISKTIFKGGTNFPGKVALKLDKNILNVIAKDYEVILITGTNGKTTTTSMIYNMIIDSGKEAITNASGANMFTGITACFISNFSFKKLKNKKYAIIEVDEANVKYITQYITPKVITITNLFRDQLDRYGEVYTTLEKILEGIVTVPSTTLILNGDESLLGKLHVNNETLYYGFKTSDNHNTKIDINADAKFCKFCKAPYKYHFVTYNHLGDYYCEECGYKRPVLNFVVDKIIDQTPAGSLISIDNCEYYINQPGTYNIYNALCAYSVSKYLGIENEIINSSLQNQKSSFGRQETLNIEDKEVKIILVKNPAGYDQAINTIMLDKNNINISFMLNDNYADGRDISWIWDVNFEKLTSLNIDKIIVSGIRLCDMAVRLKVAGFDENKFTLCEDYDNLLKEILSCREKNVYILATYTAMTGLRKYLHGKGYIDEVWS
jgi:UDP-N-acetylmuramyl tripeptide synthase